MKKIILTGGGTAGHVTPNIALIPELVRRGFEIKYIGSKDGIEKKLIEAEGIPYFGVSSGKLRRYRSIKNLSDPFRVLHGCDEAARILKKEKPDIIFSKGGFVSVPVMLAGQAMHIPCVIHESDMTPGLANKIAGKKASAFCCNFPETVELLPKGKAIHTGTPIRQQLFEGSREKGLSFAGLSGKKPVLMIICGSLGSVAVNGFVREALPRFIEKFDIIHLTGKGNLDESLVGKYDGYKQFEYISGELPDLFAAADILISRAGANAICEIAALAKPNVLIPLPLSASRGDQIKNAESFEKQGFSAVLDQDSCTASDVADCVFSVYETRDAYIEKMKENASGNGAIMKIADLLERLVEGDV